MRVCLHWQPRDNSRIHRYQKALWILRNDRCVCKRPVSVTVRSNRRIANYSCSKLDWFLERRPRLEKCSKKRAVPTRPSVRRCAYSVQCEYSWTWANREKNPLYKLATNNYRYRSKSYMFRQFERVSDILSRIRNIHYRHFETLSFPRPVSRRLLEHNSKPCTGSANFDILESLYFSRKKRNSFFSSRH